MSKPTNRHNNSSQSVSCASPSSLQWFDSKCPITESSSNLLISSFKLLPHLNSPFSNLSVTPHISSNSLHSPNTEKRCYHTLLPPACPLWTCIQYLLQEPQLSGIILLTVCIPTPTKAAVLLWCFGHFSTHLANSDWKDSTFSISACVINQFSHPYNRMGITQATRWERTKVTLKSTYATKWKKDRLAFLMFSSTDLFQQIPLPPKSQTPSYILSWQTDWTIHYILWNIQWSTLQPLENITTSHLPTFTFKKQTPSP